VSDIFGGTAKGILARVQRTNEAKDKGTKRGLRVGGEHVLGVSNERVPHEDGDLERSGAVSQDDDGNTAISYDTPYAIRQHEDMSLHHDSGRQAKYLESAILSERATVLQIVAAAIKKEIGL
jgi:hypothetical protein